MLRERQVLDGDLPFPARLANVSSVPDSASRCRPYSHTQLLNLALHERNDRLALLHTCGSAPKQIPAIVAGSYCSREGLLEILGGPSALIKIPATSVFSKLRSRLPIGTPGLRFRADPQGWGSRYSGLRIGSFPAVREASQARTTTVALVALFGGLICVENRSAYRPRSPNSAIVAGCLESNRSR